MPWLPLFLTPGKAYTQHANRTRIARTLEPTMPTPPLTVRNLAPTPLTLTHVAHYAATPSRLAAARDAVGPANATAIGNVFSTAASAVGLGASATSAATALDARRIPGDAPPTDQHDVQLRLAPFATTTTDVQVADGDAHGLLRLTFDADGHAYTVDLPSPSAESQPLRAVGDAPALALTAVYLPEHAHLALLSSANLDAWMGTLPDATPLDALSIPGTHNSPTCHRALPSVRCQAVPPRAQLENGVRFLDVRVQPDAAGGDALQLVHSVFPIAMTGARTLREHLLPELFAFLDAHPSETLILSLKREGTGGATDEALSRVLLDAYITRDPHRWYTSPLMPTLGQARGKIVLLRRFNLDPAVADAGRTAHGDHPDLGSWGLDASVWADNTPYDAQRAVAVQDFYEVLDSHNIDTKLSYATAMLDRTAARPAGPPGPLHINFLTASNFWRVGCWPERIAAQLNPGVTRYLCCVFGMAQERGEKEGLGQTGVVVTDWCGADGDWDLVRCVVGMNARLLK